MTRKETRKMLNYGVYTSAKYQKIGLRDICVSAG